MNTELKPVGYSPENLKAAIEEVKTIFADLKISQSYKSINPCPDAYGVVVQLAVYGISFPTVGKLMELSLRYGLVFNTIESDEKGELIITMATAYNLISEGAFKVNGYKPKN